MLPLLLAAAAPPPPAAPCSGSGALRGGRCACEPPFGGPDCVGLVQGPPTAPRGVFAPRGVLERDGALLSVNLTFNGLQPLRFGNPPKDHVYNTTAISRYQLPPPFVPYL